MSVFQPPLTPHQVVRYAQSGAAVATEVMDRVYFGLTENIVIRDGWLIVLSDKIAHQDKQGNFDFEEFDLLEVLVQISLAHTVFLLTSGNTILARGERKGGETLFYLTGAVPK